MLMARPPSRLTQRVAARSKISAAGARRYGGRSQQERRDQRRARLLDAGFDLFGTRGYGAASIELICAKAGVTARHFYEQFESREALLLAVYEGVIGRVWQAILKALWAKEADPRKRVAAALEVYVHTILDDPRNARIACVEVVGASAKLEQRRRKAIHEFASVIEAQANELAKQGRMPRGDFGLTSIAMAGAVNELITDAITRKTPPPVSDIVEALVRIFLAFIAGSRKESSARRRG
jgi:AcrR family transcriptional regulator